MALHEVTRWVETNGEVRAIDRLRVALLPDLMAEGILLAKVDSSTTCSPQLLSRVTSEASTIVGKPCPF